MAGTYLDKQGWVVSNEDGEPVLTDQGTGTGAGIPDVPNEPKKDTDVDSWDSGSNEKDVMDNVEYEDVSSPEGPVEDEGDEDDLGNELDGEPDPDEVSLADNIEPLDDEDIDDRTFDCD